MDVYQRDNVIELCAWKDRKGRTYSDAFLEQHGFHYTNVPGGAISKKLEITHVEKNDCGSTVYSAQLPIDIRESYQEFKGLLAMTKDSGLRNSDPVNGARFNLTLIDHRTRICEDHRAYAWEVSVREGYGWCGTMDSVFEAVGNPEPVYTIMMDPAAIDY